MRVVHSILDGGTVEGQKVLHADTEWNNLVAA